MVGNLVPSKFHLEHLILVIELFFWKKNHFTSLFLSLVKKSQLFNKFFVWITQVVKVPVFSLLFCLLNMQGSEAITIINTLHQGLT